MPFRLQNRKPRTVGSLLSAICLLATVSGCTTLRDPQALRRDHLAEEMKFHLSRSIELSEPLTLNKAIELAVENNLDYTLLVQEQAIRNEAATGAKLGMLPNLIASANMERASKFRASRSTSVTSGQESLAASYSQEKTKRTANLNMAWNLLDFGISYYRARQAGDQSAIVAERIRRTRQNLVLDVSRAYYRAMISEQAYEEAKAILATAKERQKTIDQQVADKTISEEEGLMTRETIIIMRMRLEEFAAEYRNARIELVALLGLSPESELSFPAPEGDDAMKRLEFDMKQLERTALEHRPELFEKDREQRIAEAETRTALLGMLPNLNLFVSADTDRNAFLYYHNWYTAGFRAAVDLFSIPQKASKFKQSKLEKELATRRRRAVAVSVMIQVRLSQLGYDNAQKQYEILNELNQVRQQRLEEVKQRVKGGAANTADILRAEADAFFARVRLLNAVAGVRVSEQRIANSLGFACKLSESPLFAPKTVEKKATAEAVIEESIGCALPHPLQVIAERQDTPASKPLETTSETESNVEPEAKPEPTTDAAPQAPEPSKPDEVRVSVVQEPVVEEATEAPVAVETNETSASQNDANDVFAELADEEIVMPAAEQPGPVLEIFISESAGNALPHPLQVIADRQNHPAENAPATKPAPAKTPGKPVAPKSDDLSERVNLPAQSAKPRAPEGDQNASALPHPMRVFLRWQNDPAPKSTKPGSDALQSTDI